MTVSREKSFCRDGVLALHFRHGRREITHPREKHSGGTINGTNDGTLDAERRGSNNGSNNSRVLIVIVDFLDLEAKSQNSIHRLRKSFRFFHAKHLQAKFIGCLAHKICGAMNSVQTEVYKVWWVRPNFTHS